jgi:CDP-4-dehydro-6-deoxyglucose reductase, E1
MIKLIKSTFYHETQTKRLLNKFITQAPILSFGKKCEEFETRFSKWQGRNHGVLVNSGSSANLAIIQALLNLGRIKRGDRVGFSAVSWSTNVMPLIQLGLKPVPIDVTLETLNISSDLLEVVLKKNKIVLLFLTNLLGFCGDIEKIRNICRKHHIILIEDNCESLGSVYQGTKLGNFGLASTFSFYVGHHMSTIEGGLVATDDDELATMLKLVRAHGWDRNLSFIEKKAIRKTFRINSAFYSRYTFYDLGFNLRPTEITGFLGLIQLKFIDQIVSKRQQNFRKLAKLIYSQTDRFYPIKFEHLDIISNFAVPVICRTQKIRDDLVKKCAGRIEIRPIVGGNLTQQPFFAKYIAGSKSYPNADIIHNQGLYFANNPELTGKEIRLIISIFANR